MRLAGSVADTNMRSIAMPLTPGADVRAPKVEPADNGLTRSVRYRVSAY